MPDRSDKLLERGEKAGQYELPYVSKSRVMQWVSNKEHFRLKYLEGIREPETDAMVRGTRIHKTFEYYYEQLLEADAGVTIQDDIPLPDNRQLWADFIEPYITNFAVWERDRWEESGKHPDAFLPLAIEEEIWSTNIIDYGPEWMGLTDVILPAASIEQVDSDSGAVVVDFKTGSVPNEEYRDTGIYMELAYYELLFEDEYNVVGGAAYYPRANELLVRPEGSYKEDVVEAGRELVTACEEYDGDTMFKANEGPLCGWSPEEGDRSPYYGICSQCTWNKPVDNRNTFEQMLEEGYHDGEIAEVLGCSMNAVNYWKWKLNNE